MFLSSIVAAGIFLSAASEDKAEIKVEKPVKVDASKSYSIGKKKVYAKVYYKKKYRKKTYTKAYYKKKIRKRKHVRAAYRTSRRVGASKHTVNADYVESTGRCSCSLHTDYKEHSSRFNNYCPFCGRHGTLRYEEGRTCPEGMWVCSKCDADFCLVHGKSHTSRAKYLSPA